MRVCGEVSQPKLSSGHLYFSLKDNSNNIRSIIWKSKNIDKELLKEGNKVTLDVKIDFYGGSGSVSLIVDKLIQNDGIGELQIKYDKIKSKFIKKGYFDIDRKKPLPQIIKKILIITSEDGAALQDFIYNLNNNNSNIEYDIEDVKVQGVECPSNICDLLLNLKTINKQYDLVVITRGGGSFADLFGFSQPELIESVYNFHLPVLSAIGHQVDNPLLDLIADVSTPTPSLAAQFIVDHNKKYINSLYKKVDSIKLDLINTITNKQKQLYLLNDNLLKQFENFKNIRNKYKNKLIEMINKQIIDLAVLDSQMTMKIENQQEKKVHNIENPENIVLYNKNIRITDAEDLNDLIGSKIRLKWGDKEFKIKIVKCNS